MNKQIIDFIKEQINNLDIFKVIYEDLQNIKNIAKMFENFEKVIVIGTGGSSLGGKCLSNFQAMISGVTSKVIFLENVDSLHFHNVITKCNPQKTGVIVISKSGRTTEPLMLFLTLCEMWKDFDCSKQAIAITELSQNNDIKNLAESKEMNVIEHNPKIGGRFSVFSVVGLLPAVIAGCNINEFIESARSVLDAIKLYTADHCPLINEAIAMYEVFCDGKINQHVIFAYTDMLEDYGKWAVQLISESLGKSAEFGITPVRAIGTVDQHSMLQLFLGGPLNKFYTVIKVKNNYETPCISSNVQTKIIETLNGHNINDLMNAHARSTIEVLKKVAKVRVIEFDKLGFSELGELMIRNFIEVLVIAKLANINPYNQPAVEESKKLAMQYLQLS